VAAASPPVGLAAIRQAWMRNQKFASWLFVFCTPVPGTGATPPRVVQRRPAFPPWTLCRQFFLQKVPCAGARNHLHWNKRNYPMSDQTDRFLKMFREEIEESLDNIQYLADSYERKFKNGEITNYVYNENEAFLAQEIAGLRRFLAFIASVAQGSLAVKTPEDIAIMIGDVIKKKAKDYEDPEAVYHIVSKKLEKTLRYLVFRQDS
jgi:hypothetical protein